MCERKSRIELVMSYERFTDEEKGIQQRIGLPSMDCRHHHREQSRRKHPWQHNWHPLHHHHHHLFISNSNTLPSPTPPIANLTCLLFICARPVYAQEAIPSAFWNEIAPSSNPQCPNATMAIQGSTLLSSSRLAVTQNVMFVMQIGTWKVVHTPTTNERQGRRSKLPGESAFPKCQWPLNVETTLDAGVYLPKASDTSRKMTWTARIVWQVHMSIVSQGGDGCDTRATPKTPAPVTKNTSPTYSLEIQAWDFSWLELLEWLKEGG